MKELKTFAQNSFEAEKLEEVDYLLKEVVGVPIEEKHIEWLVLYTRQQIETLLEYSPYVKFYPNPETIGYKVANDFTRTFYGKYMKEVVK